MCRQKDGYGMKIVIAAEFEYLKGWLSSIDSLMEAPDDKILYNGRNKIVLCCSPQGDKLVIKRYKKHNIIKRIVYTLFKPNKAERAFRNAVELRNRNFDTPHEVAYAEKSCFGFITQVYYVCAFTDGKSVRSELIEREPYNADLAGAYAGFVASLHDAGVLHKDLNPTNVLYRKEQGSYRFELIDINRMRFYEEAVPKKECMENLTLFWWLTDVYRYVLGKYAMNRGWSQNDVDEAVRVKQRHDRSWVRRKKFTGLIKKYILGKR